MANKVYRNALIFILFGLAGALLFSFNNCGQMMAGELASTGDLSGLHSAEGQLPSTGDPTSPTATASASPSGAASGSGSGVSSSTSLSPALAARGVCALRGGAGAYLARIAFSSQADCQGQCDALASSNPNRVCTWKGQTLQGSPLQACVIQTGLHAQLSSAQLNFQQCQAACATAASTQNNLFCDWGTDRFHQPAAEAECKIVGGAGKMLLNPTAFVSQSDCQSLCDQNSTNAYRTCTYGKQILFQPGASSKCEIWGGAGKVLAPPFFGLQSDCVQRCASFATTNPNRLCFYGSGRIQ